MIACQTIRGIRNGSRAPCYDTKEHGMGGIEGITERIQEILSREDGGIVQTEKLA